MHSALRNASMYGTAAARVALRRKLSGGYRPREQRLIFIVGSPRSGTTFLGQTLGRHPGVVDLDEVQPLKAAIPGLVGLSEEDQARQFRRTLELVRLLGLVRRLRGVEQTPETSFVLRAALRAYPRATAVHMLRDGRDGKPKTGNMMRALALRVGLSVLLFACILISYWAGWIQPTGIPLGK